MTLTRQARRAARKVGTIAREKATNAGVPIVYAKDGFIIREYPDGHTEVVRPTLAGLGLPPKKN
ncbi:MAG: hypothetical protein WCG80_10570 [Spirochaetales bacterium]